MRYDETIAHVAALRLTCRGAGFNPARICPQQNGSGASDWVVTDSETGSAAANYDEVRALAYVLEHETPHAETSEMDHDWDHMWTRHTAAVELTPVTLAFAIAVLELDILRLSERKSALAIEESAVRTELRARAPGSNEAERRAHYEREAMQQPELQRVLEESRVFAHGEEIKRIELNLMKRHYELKLKGIAS